MFEIAKSVLLICCSVIGAVIVIKNSNLTTKKDAKAETRSNTILETKLDYVVKGIDDIKLDSRDQGRQINDVSERVTRVEESCKSAHKRIDEIESKK